MEIGETSDPLGFGGEKDARVAVLDGAGETSAAAFAQEIAPAAAAALRAFVAEDPASRALLHEIRRVAPGASTVLLRGESGAGKHLLAALIHYLGPNPAEPLITVDCASLPPELLEQELFGVERNGQSPKRGAVELVHEGTLVLDEVAALSMPLQARLLRAVEDRRFERAGGTHALAARARVVAMTSVDLEHAVARRTFREDLYYRLNVIAVRVPSLRERPADIRPLAEKFLARACDLHRKPQMTLDAAALAALQGYAYPGNVRELRYIVERAAVAGAGATVMPEDLPEHMNRARSSAGKMSLEQLEREHIAHVLEGTRGKKSMAAQILGISRKTLLEKRKRYGLA